MTLAEQLRNEGFTQGMQQGEIMGLLKGMEMDIYLKFGASPEAPKFVEAMKPITDMEAIKRIKMALLKANTLSELFVAIQSKPDA